MKALLGIAVAGALGAVGRYGLEGAVSNRFPGVFPWGTFTVNMSGSFVIGALFVVLSERVVVAGWVRSSLTIGFIGAYTTFSTLSLEAARLVQDGSYLVAAAYGVGSLALGLVFVFLGMAAGRLV